MDFCENSQRLKIIYTENSIINVWQGPKYVYAHAQN